MPDQVQLRGGTESENDAFTGKQREVTVDTTNNTLRVHDNSTLGGHKLATTTYVDSEVDALTTQTNQQIDNLTPAEPDQPGYVYVPGSSKHGTLPGFWVMKYPAKDVGGVPTSQAEGTPWASISWTDTKVAIEQLGPGYHLINDYEWMTIAENIAATPINNQDSSGFKLARGHSDNNPSNAIESTEADEPVVSGCDLTKPMDDVANAYQAGVCEIRGDGTDSKGYVNTGNSWSEAWTTLGGGQEQLRTHVLSNGEVLWDIAGNTWEWTDAYVVEVDEKPTPVQDSYNDYTNITDYKGFSYLRPSNPSWTRADNGIGSVLTHTFTGTRAFRRGGSWITASHAGVFALDLVYTPSHTNLGQGFRVAWYAS